MQVAYGRIPNVDLKKDNSELCLFVLDSHGRKITGVQEQTILLQRMEEEVGNPVRIKVGTRGIDTELIVATPIEKGGRGRPGVFYNITQALVILDISIFKVNLSFQSIVVPRLCSSRCLIQFFTDIISLFSFLSIAFSFDNSLTYLLACDLKSSLWNDTNINFASCYFPEVLVS